ncbi:carbamoyltransferase [Burkholderia thailandensis]|uniref:carbamoyltransferase family protein n=1 Tax=Burkholderia thailandensis TaxID=57975 RepID=UPI00016A579F|nr:carbamoyltransferase C-terminal domain-containing protein [Burkholderia thailandensis]AIP67095.1 carbamoyltransferase [Burkholderia thailandensis]AOI55197.1 carbamoyltransferase [Burkholderia thailandensis]
MTGAWVLGLAASQHNGAACLMRGDKIVVAIAEERLSRVKRQGIAGARASLAFDYCLSAAGISARSLDRVVLCTQTSRHLPEHDVRSNPQLASLAHDGRIRFISHHVGHALSALRWAGAPDAAVLVVDGLGSPVQDLPADERELAAPTLSGPGETLSMYHAHGWRLKVIDKSFAECDRWLTVDGKTAPRYASLGGMYAAVSQHVFNDALEAGKVMGLASHGEPRIPATEFLHIRQNSQIEFGDVLARRFAARSRANRITSAHKTLAASAQAALEEALLAVAKRLRTLTGEPRLCLAGGIALNAIANERLLRQSGFDQICVIPAADDSGTAIGAAMAGLLELGSHISTQAMRDDGLGRCYDNLEIQSAFESVPGLRCIVPRCVATHAAERIAQGQIGGWVQGGAEFGPRALGHRSIIADPRSQYTKRRLDKRIKLREAFRPYAPVVLHAKAARWFDVGRDDESPFMLRIMPVREACRDAVPAVVHVDGTARIQTVRAADGLFFRVVKAFDRFTGVPMLLNTSFNARGEPIVETPQQALWSLIGMGLDFCAIGPFLFEPSEDRRQLLRARIVLFDAKDRESPTVRKRLAMQGDPLLAPLLDLVDRRCTAAEIGERLSASLGRSIPRARLIALICRLASLQLVGLTR